MKSRQTADERFWSKVQVGSERECWPWTRAADWFGHGKFKVRSYVTVSAHRFAYEQHYGPIPAGQVIRHICDNPACCNPAHLVVGEHADNVADRVRRNRSANGERNGRAKLNRQQVEVIKQRRANGETLTALGAEYGVHYTTIAHVVNGRDWK
jgi:hypothetical protein